MHKLSFELSHHKVTLLISETSLNKPLSKSNIIHIPSVTLQLGQQQTPQTCFVLYHHPHSFFTYSTLSFIQQILIVDLLGTTSSSKCWTIQTRLLPSWDLWSPTDFIDFDLLYTPVVNAALGTNPYAIPSQILTTVWCSMNAPPLSLWLKESNLFGSPLNTLI